MTKLNHLIELILTLQYKELTTASELAQILEVNKKTVYRYIETLMESNIPVFTKKGRYGGFYLDQSFFMKQPKLERKELEALIMAADILTNQKGFAYEKNLRSAVSKIKSTTLSEDIKLQDMKQELDFSIKNISGLESNDEKIAKINAAMARGRVLEITYYSIGRSSTSRLRMEPYSIFYKNGEWHLAGKNNTSDSIEVLDISRIKKTKITDEIYLKPSNVEFTKTVSEPDDSESSSKTVRIRFDRKVADFITEGVWHRSQSFERLGDGSVMLHLKSEEYSEIKKWLLSFGADAEIVEPEFLRNEIKAEAERIASIYK